MVYQLRPFRTKDFNLTITIYVHGQRTSWRPPQSSLSKAILLLAIKPTQWRVFLHFTSTQFPPRLSTIFSMASPSASSSSSLTLNVNRDTYSNHSHPSYLSGNKYPDTLPKSATDFPAKPTTNSSSSSSGSYISGDYSDADGEGDDDDEEYADYVESQGEYATVVPAEYYEDL